MVVVVWVACWPVQQEGGARGVFDLPDPELLEAEGIHPAVGTHVRNGCMIPQNVQHVLHPFGRIVLEEQLNQYRSLELARIGR